MGQENPTVTTKLHTPKLLRHNQKYHRVATFSHDVVIVTGKTHPANVGGKNQDSWGNSYTGCI